MKALIIVLTLLTGCVSVAEMRGRLPTEPTSSSLRGMTERWVNRRAKDPESLQIRGVSSSARPAYMSPTLFTPRRVGWTWDASLNLRNGFGGYGGFKVYVFFIDENGLIFGTTKHPWTNPFHVLP